MPRAGGGQVLAGAERVGVRVVDVEVARSAARGVAAAGEQRRRSSSSAVPISLRGGSSATGAAREAARRGHVDRDVGVERGERQRRRRAERDERAAGVEPLEISDRAAAVGVDLDREREAASGPRVGLDRCAAATSAWRAAVVDADRARSSPGAVTSATEIVPISPAAGAARRARQRDERAQRRRGHGSSRRPRRSRLHRPIERGARDAAHAHGLAPRAAPAIDLDRRRARRRARARAARSPRRWPRRRPAARSPRP